MTESKDGLEFGKEKDRTEFKKKAVVTATLGATAIFLDWLLGDEEAYVLADGSVQVVKKGFFSSLFLGDEAGTGAVEVQPLSSHSYPETRGVVKPIRRQDPVIFNSRTGSKSAKKQQFFNKMKETKHTDESVVDLFNIMGRLLDR